MRQESLRDQVHPIHGSGRRDRPALRTSARGDRLGRRRCTRVHSVPGRGILLCPTIGNYDVSARQHRHKGLHIRASAVDNGGQGPRQRQRKKKMCGPCRSPSSDYKDACENIQRWCILQRMRRGRVDTWSDGAEGEMKFPLRPEVVRGPADQLFL